MRWTCIALAAGTLLIGCGGPEDPRAEDLTAEEHEAEAQRELREAEETADHYRAVYYGPEVYNPTEAHLYDAAVHQAHAEAHRLRASELRAYEAVECVEFPPETRAACPLLLEVVDVSNIDGGVRITFAESVDIAPVVDHVRCHLAFAAAEGGEGLEDCGLYVPGARAVSVPGENVIQLTTDQPEHIPELRRRVAIQAH